MEAFSVSPIVRLLLVVKLPKLVISPVTFKFPSITAFLSNKEGIFIYILLWEIDIILILSCSITKFFVIPEVFWPNIKSPVFIFGSLFTVSKLTKLERDDYIYNILSLVLYIGVLPTYIDIFCFIYTLKIK